MRSSARVIIPLSLAAALLASVGVALATNTWSAVGSGIADPDGEVHAVALSGASVYIGGDFQNAGGDADADNVAVWDGAAWRAFGTAPLDGEVNALAVSGASVYAGGAFEDAGGNLNADFIARWDGAQWQALGAPALNGTAPVVYAVAVTGTNVYVGGDFLDLGGANGDFIARWNGSAWSALGSTPLNAPVHALAVTGTNVYAGGDFLDLGGVAGDFIARWNGSAWSPLGATPLNGPVRTIAVVGADVYAGGSFTDAGGNPNADYVARWDGAQWRALGSGVTGEVRALAVMGTTDLFVGGSFTSAGGNGLARRVARWNGLGWLALSPTVNDAVYALGITGMQVYVGGRFTDAGGLANADRIARWDVAAAIPANAAPSALDDTAMIFEDAGASIAVLANDTDPNPGDALSVIAFSGLSNGTATTPDGLSALFTPATDFNGTAGFTYAVQDTGALTDTARVTVTVQPVNDPPSLSLGPDPVINEDTGGLQVVTGWVSNPSPGPADEIAAGQTVTWSSAYSNPELFVTPPSVDAAGTLTYQIQTNNLFGVAVITVTAIDTGGTANGGVNFRAYPAYLVISPVNDPPAFTPGPNQAVNEDAGPQTVAGWASGISVGPANEAGQTVTFSVTNTAPSLFSAQPAVAPDGTLTFTPAANAFGSATVTVAIRDDGGTANGGDDTGNTANFTLTVNPVNDAPAFTPGPNQAVNEDAGAQTVAGWASGISAGPANEAGQAVTFVVTNTNSALFSAQPAVAANGTLAFTPAANAFGSATVNVTINDNGGTANGGDDTGNTATFTLTVNPVNDAPSFSLIAATVPYTEDLGTYAQSGFAVNISPGPANEAGQVVTFTVTVTETAFFSTQPALSSSGSLTFRTAKDKNGSRLATVTLRDSGGTTNGGVDTSAAQTFTIAITAVNDAPVNTIPPGQTTPENTPLTFSLATSNAISVTDVDAGSNAISVTLAVSDGVLSLSRTTGLTFAIGDGSADALMHFRGSQSNINAALNGAVYAPTAAFNGLTGIVVTSNDRGASGSGGAQTDADTLWIDVGSVNDPPQILLPAGPLSVNEDTDLVFSTEAGTAVVIDDRDAAAGAISVTLTAAHGALSLNGTAGLTFLAGDGVADATLAFTGALANVNAALDGLTFTPNSDYNGPASIALSVDDQGHTGSGGPLTDADSLALDVIALNDAPSFTPGPDLSVYREDGAQIIPGWATAISPGPADEAGQTLAFTLTSDNLGLFTVQPALDPATGALTFTPAPDQEGAAVVTVTLSDDGGTAGGGVDASPPHTLTITISPRPIFYVFLPTIRR